MACTTSVLLQLVFWFSLFFSFPNLRVGQATTGGFQDGLKPSCKQVTVCVVVVPGQVHVTLVLTGYCPVILGGHGVGGAEQPARDTHKLKKTLVMQIFCSYAWKSMLLCI